MTYTMKDFEKDFVKEHLDVLSPDERLKGISTDEMLKKIPKNERLKGLSEEEIRQYLEKLIKQ